ncbi:MAG: radical SAM protein, partial [Bradyrhizobium sp.]
MAIPFFKEMRIGGYLVKQKLLGRKRYPMVLMLEPLFRCNLECAGCGKIDYPDEILNQRLSIKQCMDAIDECGAPAVSIAGGEPLLHRDMPKIVQGFLERDKFVILCTNALLLAKKIDQYKPDPNFTWSI